MDVKTVVERHRIGLACSTALVMVGLTATASSDLLISMLIGGGSEEASVLIASMAVSGSS
eukprot:765660-Hanusia_phi.AAC.6